ncbi:MAG: hypothetical protein QM765_02030 [Myxococcales bacterium]
MSRRILTLACAGLLLAVGTGCPPPSTECTKPSDCKDGKTCVDNKCVEPSSACSPACSGTTPVCDSVAKKCKTCTASAGCTSPKLCDTSVTLGKCVSCRTSSDCGLETPVCDVSTKTCVTCNDAEGCQVGETCDTSVPGGECVTAGCSGDLDCQLTAATPVCDTAAHKCVVCTASKGCTLPATCDTTVQGGQCKGCTASSQCTTGNAKVCDTASGQCVTCTTGEGCTAPQVCDTTVQGGQCKQQGCNSSVDCAGTPATPVCDTAANKCVVCTSTEGCANGKKCDTTVQGGLCIDATCTDDNSCATTPATPICDTTSGKCVVCTDAKGCTAPASCDTTIPGGQCKGCTASNQCTTGTANVCDTATGKCVVCTGTEGCGANEHCDLTVQGGKCVSNGCTDNSGCTGTPTTPNCDTTTGKCVLCNAAVACGAPLVCDTSVTGGKCVDCLQGSDCVGAKKVCDQKKCVTCTAAAGCAAPTPVCDTTVTGGACVACTADTDCASVGKVCDTSTKTCVTCTAGKGCTGTTPVCDTAVTGGTCVGCTTSAQCATNSPTKPVCDAASKTCVFCTATEGCTNQGKVCQSGTACVDCLQNTDCKVAATPICDTTQHKCVTCTGSAGCNSPQTCQNGQCVGCVDNTSCSSGTPVCDTSNGTCVVCTGSAGCTPPKTCDLTVTGGACVGCASNTDCAAPTPACDTTTAQCVTCTANGSGCSGTTPKCKTGTAPVCVQCLLDADCTNPLLPQCGASNVCVAAATDVNAQITAARAAEGTGLALAIDGATVTYLRPSGLGQYDSPGFFVQGSQTGPALFVQVDPTTLTPVPAVGDKVNFTVTEMASLTNTTWNYTRTALAISSFSRVAQGVDVDATLRKDASSVLFPDSVGDWENEYVKLDNAVVVAVRSGGTGWAKWTITTPGVTAATINFTLRVPYAIATAYDLVPGCTVNVNKGIVWRNHPSYDEAQISAYAAADVSASCPAPKVVSATAPTATTVNIAFDRSIESGDHRGHRHPVHLHQWLAGHGGGSRGLGQGRSW